MNQKSGLHLDRYAVWDSISPAEDDNEILQHLDSTFLSKFRINFLSFFLGSSFLVLALWKCLQIRQMKKAVKYSKLKEITEPLMNGSEI